MSYCDFINLGTGRDVYILNLSHVVMIRRDDETNSLLVLTTDDRRITLGADDARVLLSSLGRVGGREVYHAVR